MKAGSHRLALLELHLAALLFGLAGVLGKAITASALIIVFGRSGLAAVTLGLGMLVTRQAFAPPGGGRSALLASGLLLAVHWLAFFHAINLSTVAIGVVGYATFPLFVVLLEPLLGSARLRPADGLTALGVLLGLTLVAAPTDAGSHLGALAWAVFSGFTFAALTLLNRHLVGRHSYLLVALFQQSGAALCLLPVVLLTADGVPGPRDLLLIGVLGLVCSALAQTLFVKSLKQVRAQLASVITGLEPVYAIALAALFLGDRPAAQTLGGAAIVLLAVTVATRLHPGPVVRKP